MKFDDKAVPLQLIPPEALMEVAKVLGYGAKKYAVNDWRRDTIQNIPMSRTYGSIQRHLNKWYAGEDVDPDTGLNHIAHATTQCMILLMALQEAPEAMDDRYTTTDKKK